MAEEADGWTVQRLRQLRRRLVATRDPNLETVRTELGLEPRQDPAREAAQAVERDDPFEVPDEEDPRLALGLRGHARIRHGRPQVLACGRAAPPQPRGVMRGEGAARRALVQQPHEECRLAA